jgi:hypothetical protein
MLNESSDTLTWAFTGSLAALVGRDTLVVYPGQEVLLDEGFKRGRERDFDCSNGFDPKFYTLTTAKGQSLKKTIFNGYAWEASSEQERCVADWDCIFIIRDQDLE